MVLKSSIISWFNAPDCDMMRNVMNINDLKIIYTWKILSFQYFSIFKLQMDYGCISFCYYISMLVVDLGRFLNTQPMLVGPSYQRLLNNLSQIYIYTQYILEALGYTMHLSICQGTRTMHLS